MENYMQYHVMGSVCKIRLIPNCLASKFECQPDQRKCTASKQRSAVTKRRHTYMVQELLAKNTETLSTLDKTCSRGE